MQLIFLHGLPGVGKLTVAQALAKLTSFKVFHNHLAVDLATAVFEFGSEGFVKLREKVWLETFALAVREKLPGMIFTFAPDRTVTSDFIGQVRQIAEAGGAELVFVELICSEAELERRIVAPSRKKFGKLSSIDQFRALNRAAAFVTPGIPKDSLTIDTTILPPLETALRLTRSLGIETIGPIPLTETVQDAYSDWASTYDGDRNLTRDLDQRVTERHFGSEGSERFTSILELGCGTGKNTVLLAGMGDRVLALDFAEAMLARARGKVKGFDNVTFLSADLTEPWPCESQFADLIVCNLVLEHIEDLRFVFAEAARCLVSSGKFFVSELHPFRQYQGTKANFRRADETKQVAAFVHHPSDFISAAAESGLVLEALNEWWHEEDQQKPPRLITFEFRKIGL